MSSQLQWSGQFEVSQNPTSSLPGDKILLPSSTLEQLLEAAPRIVTESRRTASPSFDPFNPHSFAAERHARAWSREHQPQLPHPLTFRLVNPLNNRIVYAGIKEFSAAEGQAVLSPFLSAALGISADGQGSERNGTATPPKHLVTIHAKQLPRGTFVKLRPLEAGYDPQDWKSLLEDYLRRNFTTLTRGEMLSVPSRHLSSNETQGSYRFLIDQVKPEGEGICIVDTDLEVDIEALNEDQARETVQRIAQRARAAPGTADGSSPGGILSLFKNQAGQILEREYVQYELPSWDRTSGVQIELAQEDDGDCLNLFLSPFGPRQRAKPRADQHMVGDFSERRLKRIKLGPTNVAMEDAEALWISVHAPAESACGRPAMHHYTIRARPLDPTEGDDEPQTNGVAGPDETICENCQKPVPARSIVLHQNFCLRNNVLCPHGCGRVFQKRSEAWQNHWHCEHDSANGDSLESHSRHDQVHHIPCSCPDCPYTAASLPELAQHRTSICPGKLILCRFCHLEVAQEGDPDNPDAEAIISGLTPHELADGSRTTDCHICSKIVRLRDMDTHIKHHDLERLDREAPRPCRNVNCGRTLDGTSRTGDTRAGVRIGQGAGNAIDLCSQCFGPLYVSTYDPDGKALKRRVERKYLSQLLTGCGNSWCQNEFCKTARRRSGRDETNGAKEALTLCKPYLDALLDCSLPLHFCVDEASQKRRGLAALLAAGSGHPGEKRYAVEWCLGALEAEGGDFERARTWLEHFAPAQEL